MNATAFKCSRTYNHNALSSKNVGDQQQDSPDRSAPSPDPTPVQENARQNTDPLTDEQIARYRGRMKSGYYLSDAIRRRVAERLCGKMLSEK
jgi:hypothetical protein